MNVAKHVMVALVLLVGTSVGGAEAEGGKGYRCLFMGHSFFAPVAKVFHGLAGKVGLEGHSQDVVYRGGKGGSPKSLWQNQGVRRTAEAILQTGKVDLLGMTYYDAQTSAVEDYQRWIDLALKHNPKTDIFIGLSWGRRWDAQRKPRELEEYKKTGLAFGWRFREQTVAKLRQLYPNTRIVCCYYGAASGELWKMQQAGQLPGIESLVGRKNAVFTDAMGHAGAVLKDVSAMIWLSTIYDIDLHKTDLKLKYAADVQAVAHRLASMEAARKTGSANATPDNSKQP